MNYKTYLHSLRSLIVLAALIFILFAFLGYLIAQNSPEKAWQLIGEFEQMYGPILEASPFVQFILVFLNNSFSLILIILLGIIFGILPVLALFANGLLFGVFAFLVSQKLSWSAFFIILLPHGIIELPVLIVGSAIGLKIGQLFFKKVFRKPVQIKSELSLGAELYIKILLPLLAIAAAIEIFLSPTLLSF